MNKLLDATGWVFLQFQFSGQSGPLRLKPFQRPVRVMVAVGNLLTAIRVNREKWSGCWQSVDAHAQLPGQNRAVTIHG